MTCEEWMDIALDEARLALEEGEVPVGAVVVKDGQLLARAHNSREKDNDIAGHAEIVAMRMAAKQLGRWTLDGCSIYVTLEPCPMCAGAIAQARISSIYYGADDPELGGVSTRYSIFLEPKNFKSPLIYRGIKGKEAETLLSQFFSCKRK